MTPMGRPRAFALHPRAMPLGAYVRRVGAAVLALLISGAIATLGQGADPSGGEPITPLGPAETPDARKAAIGEKLFRDPRLSRNDAFACAACHRLDQGGDDGRALPIGAEGTSQEFNSPTVFNVTLNSRLNWRGNFRTIEEQNEAVLLSPQIMNTGWRELLPKLGADPGYQSAFAAAYGRPPDRASVLDALAAFQRSLVTPDARFDRHLRGETGAISADEARGYLLFKSYGCIACHQGANVGGNLFQKFGVFSDPPTQPGILANPGRFAITGLEADRHVFRVPSLRNVAATAPYFHDGSAASLDEAVAIMARTQLGRDMPQPDLARIVAFLGTLTGEYQGRPVTGDAGRRPTPGHPPP